MVILFTTCDAQNMFLTTHIDIPTNQRHMVMHDYDVSSHGNTESTYGNMKTTNMVTSKTWFLHQMVTY